MPFAGDAVIIEVGLNEGAGRGVNPNVPITPGECAADALRCRDAGASTIHWHARDPATEQQCLGDADLYAEALAAMQAGGLLGYPSYPVDPEVAVGDRLDHVWELRARGLLELAPIDVGSVSTIPWNRQLNDFVGLDWLRTQSGVVDNPLTFVIDSVDRANSLGMPCTFGAFDVGCTRVVAMLAASGRIQGPVLHKVFLSEGWAVGPVPSEAALDLHLAAASRRPRRRVVRGALLAQRPSSGRAPEPCRARTRWARTDRDRRQPRGQSAGDERRARGAGCAMGSGHRPTGGEHGRRARSTRPGRDLSKLSVVASTVGGAGGDRRRR